MKVMLALFPTATFQNVLIHRALALIALHHDKPKINEPEERYNFDDGKKSLQDFATLHATRIDIR